MNEKKRKYVILYTFHKQSLIYRNRIKEIQEINDDVGIYPIMGCGSNLYLPKKITNLGAEKNIKFMLLHNKLLYNTNFTLMSKYEPRRRNKEILNIRKELKKLNLKLFCDYTPFGYYFQDLSILNWYKQVGKNIDFEYLIFHEYDLFFNAPIRDIYKKIDGYDAGFVKFHKIEDNSKWYWTKNAYYTYLGKRALMRWLEKRDVKKNLYRSFFPGCIISKRVLEDLSRINMPPAFCELRLPTIIKGMGYNCLSLKYDTVQLRKKWDIKDMKKEKKLMYHPVYNDYEDV